MTASRRSRPIVTVVLAILTAAVLAGCGEQVADQLSPPATDVASTSTPSTSATPPTQPPAAAVVAPSAAPAEVAVPAAAPPPPAVAPAPAVTPVPATAPAPAVVPAPAPVVEAPPAASASDPEFATCKAAIAAGYGNYVRGKDPEYERYDDRDDDGVVCEH